MQPHVSRLPRGESGNMSEEECYVLQPLMGDETDAVELTPSLNQNISPSHS